ncbi:MAG: GDP-L-fucose synthase family protein [Holosporales bacterium]
MDRKDEKVLVTGAGGVIGQALIEELKNERYSNIVALSSKEVDLRDQLATDSFFSSYRPTIVFHLAARVYGIMGNMANRGIAYLDNIRINTNVIEAARAAGCRKIVAMGSTAIYSDRVKLPMSEEEIWIGEPHHSEAPYAHSKRAMLAHLESYKEQYGMDYAFCVSTNLFGPNDKFDENYGHVIPSLVSKFYRAVEYGEPLTVWGTGSPQRDFLFSFDAAYALRLVAEKYSGAINIASGQAFSIRETVNILSEVSGYKGVVQWDLSKPDGQKMREYDVSRLKQLGFKPRYTFQEALAITYEWYRSNISKVRR